MVGGGTFGWAPGEWTDDTSMAIAIAEVAATGADLQSTQALDAIAARWVEWAGEAADVGAQTRAVLRAAGPNPTGPISPRLRQPTTKAPDRSAGNGALMRTAPVALAYLHDPDALIDAAHSIAALTHHDPEAGEACALWCLAIRHAILHGTFDGLRSRPRHPSRRSRRGLGGTTRRRRTPRSRELHPQRVGRRSPPSRLVGHHPHPDP